VSPATAQSRLPVVCKPGERNDKNEECLKDRHISTTLVELAAEKYSERASCNGKTCEALRAGRNFLKVIFYGKV